MKTAEETLNEHALTMFPTTWSGVVASCIYDAMKAYGKQCAEKVLKDSANKLKAHSFVNDHEFEQVKSAIKSTPIVTP